MDSCGWRQETGRELRQDERQQGDKGSSDVQAEGSCQQRCQGLARAAQPAGDLPGVLESTRCMTLSASHSQPAEQFRPMTLGTWCPTGAGRSKDSHPSLETRKLCSRKSSWARNSELVGGPGPLPWIRGLPPAAYYLFSSYLAQSGGKGKTILKRRPQRSEDTQNQLEREQRGAGSQGRLPDFL